MSATRDAIPATGGKEPRRGLIGWLTGLLRSPLIRNGYALVMSAGITSVLGLIFWMIATRLHTPAEVGIAAALISTMLTLGNIAQLNLGNLLNRFLSVAGKGTARLICWSYLAASCMALVLSSGFVLAVRYISPELSFLANDPIYALGFIGSAVFWTIFALQDGALAGLRKSTWVPVESAIYSITKIVILVVLSQSLLAGSAIFFAWNASLPLMVIGVSYAIFRYFAPAAAAEGYPSKEISREDIARYFGWDYVGTLASMATLGFVPLLIINISGPQAVAQYHLAFTITYSLYLIGRSMSVSLLAEGAADTSRLRAMTADALLHTLLVLAAALLVIIGGAYWIMALFGANYAAESANLLRLLALSCVPWSFVTIYLAVSRTRGHLPSVAFIQISTLILMVTLSPFLLKLYGVTGMGLAWIVTHSLVTLCIIINYARRHGTARLFEWALRLVTSLARIKRSGDLQTMPVPDTVANDAGLKQFLRTTEGTKSYDWHPAWALRSLSDVETMFFSADPGVTDLASPAETALPMVVVKRASSAEGMASLTRYAAEIEVLRSDERLKALPFRLPEVLGFTTSERNAYLVERLLPGIEGRDVFRRSKLRDASIAAAIRAMTDAHDRTASRVDVDDAWLMRWIEEPAETIRAVSLPFMSRARQQEALDRLVAEQRDYWRGRSARLGLGHGDFSPGNILFNIAEAATDAATPEVSVAAIIDWESATFDAPASLDAMHLLITSRSLIHREEIGEVVCELLREAGPHKSLAKSLALALPKGGETASLSSDPDAVRVLAVFAWLQHAHSCLRKSDRYGHSRLWLAWNVERVLAGVNDIPRVQKQ